jgi:hypothetical protein
MKKSAEKILKIYILIWNRSGANKSRIAQFRIIIQVNLNVTITGISLVI